MLVRAAAPPGAVGRAFGIVTTGFGIQPTAADRCPGRDGLLTFVKRRYARLSTLIKS